MKTVMQSFQVSTYGHNFVIHNLLSFVIPRRHIWLCHCQKMGQRELAIVFRVRGVECDSSCFQWPCVLVDFLTDASALLKRVRGRRSSLGCTLFSLRNTPLRIKGVEWGKLVSRKPTRQPVVIAAWRSCFRSPDRNRPIAVAAAVATRMRSAGAVSSCVWVVRRGQTAASLHSSPSLPHRAERSSRLVKVNLPVKQTTLQTAGAPVTSEPHRASRREPRPSHLALLLPTTLGTLTCCCCVCKSFKDKCKKNNNKTKQRRESQRDSWDIPHWHFWPITCVCGQRFAVRMKEYWC